MPGGFGAKRNRGGALDRTQDVSLSLGAGSDRCGERHFPCTLGTIVSHFV